MESRVASTNTSGENTKLGPGPDEERDREPHLHFFLIKRDAVHDGETRRLVRFGVCNVCSLENCLVFGAVGMRGSVG